MATIADLLVKIGADVGELKKALDESEQGLGRIQNLGELSASAMTKLALGLTALGTLMTAALGKAAFDASVAKREVELLQGALRATGQAADTRPYQELASQMQRLTGISDETILSQQRILISFGATGEQARKLIPRILDFAAATGKDANEAVFAFGRAMTGQDMALRRMLGKMADGVSLTRNFDQALATLDSRFGGQAQILGRQLVPSIARLHEAINDLSEIFGAPILEPISRMINGLASAAEALRDFGNAHPKLIPAVTAFFSVISLLTLGAGGLLGMKLLLPKIIAMLGLTGVGAATAGKAFTVLGTRIVLSKAAMLGLNAAMKANLLGLVISAIVLVIQYWRELTAGINAGVKFIVTLFRELGQGLIKVVEGILTFNPKKIQEGLKQLSDSFGKAGRAAQQEYGDVLDIVSKKQDLAADSAEGMRKSLDQLQREYEDTAAAAKLLATEQELAATRAARIKLQQVGLTAEDVKQIEAARLKEVNEGAQKELQTRIESKREQLNEIVKLEGESSDAVKKAREELVTLERDLEMKSLENVRAIADAMVAAEKDAADQRLEVERQFRQQQLDLAKATIEAQQQVSQVQTQAIDDQRQRQLESFRLQEELRLGMLGRTVDVERQLGERVILARESLMRAHLAREESRALQLAAFRAEQVRLGFLDEQQADEMASQERIAMAQRELRERAKIEQERIQQQQRNAEIELAMVQAEMGSRLAVLQREIAVRKMTLEANQRIREEDLRAQIEIARAETLAQVAEMQARIALTKAEAEAKLRAAEMAGTITAGERDARLAQIETLDQGFLSAQSSLFKALELRQNSLYQQGLISRESTNQQMLALDQELSIKSQQIASELEAAKVKIQSGNVDQRAKTAEDLAQLELTAQRTLLEEEAKLRAKVEAGEITQAEMDRRLAPLKNAQAEITNLLVAQKQGITDSLANLETAYKDWGTRVTEALKPVKLLMDSLMNPAAGLGGAGQVNVLPLVPAVSGMVQNQEINNVFSFNGNTWRLTADETAILGRVLSMLMGPEGDALLQRWFRRQPGGGS